MEEYWGVRSSSGEEKKLGLVRIKEMLLWLSPIIISEVIIIKSTKLLDDREERAGAVKLCPVKLYGDTRSSCRLLSSAVVNRNGYSLPHHHHHHLNCC